MKRKVYLPPIVEVVCVHVEQGFAASETNPISDWNHGVF